MDRYQKVPADELIELQQMDVSRVSKLRGMQNHEQVVAVGVNLGHMRPLQAVAHGERMKAEDLRQSFGCVLIALRKVDPYKSIGTRKQVR